MLGINGLMEIDTLSGEIKLSQLFCILSEKEKEFRSKFFSLRVGPFLEGDCRAGKQTLGHKSDLNFYCGHLSVLLIIQETVNKYPDFFSFYFVLCF